MAELTGYERRRDLDAPFELTRKAELAQNKREKIRDAVRCETKMLTWEQYAAGEPRPGCGRPYRDDEPWESKGTMHFTDDERASTIRLRNRCLSSATASATRCATPSPCR